MIRIRVKNYSMILIEKLQKYQPLSSEKINKHEYLTRGEILSSNQKKKKLNKLNLLILIYKNHLKNKQK